MRPQTSGGAQRLSIRRREDGDMMGWLKCSVILDFGASISQVFEDSLQEVPVGWVLNPEHDVFFADEVQRLMRLGVAEWLENKIFEDRIHDIIHSPVSNIWNVHFKLPLHGDVCDFHVGVAGNAPHDKVPSMAVAQVVHWCQSMDIYAPQNWFSEVLGEIELNAAPWLKSGMARVCTQPVANAL